MGTILTKLGVKYNTDKAYLHNFTDFYFEHLSGYTETYTNILEIGIWDGGSLKMWEEFFKNSKIHGIDIEEKSKYDSERIKTYLCSQTNTTLLNELFEDNSLDMIIDDGSHVISHQQISLKYLLSKVKSGGIYILEDLHTSVVPTEMYECYVDGKTTLDLIKTLKNDGKFTSNFISETDFEDIKSRIDRVELLINPNESMWGSSITSILYLK